ncbi:dihydroxy-acid dehydratase ilv3 [Brettanomyces nanus]|uniref:dihydroxy-acid dehydratase n=1 Tax=Eeniella nana TaxID=13502 RepID=A0A875S2E1_EENNA|nr:dihydroxy-acid dehydratase ilv3 [Brettanomyces nanus]QPG75891.1 dihydroxy-acid dehydratase ilv3 [Brettanomyces nanus]
MSSMLSTASRATTKASSAIRCSSRLHFSTSRVQCEEEGEGRKTKFNKYSWIITEPKSNGAGQAQLYATGFKKEDFSKGQVGIGSCWWSGNPCNMHLLGLNNLCRDSVEKAGLKGMQFNTVGVSDGMSMGTTGMRYSLPSREVIADSFETIMQGQHYDANIGIPGCDKNMPGVLMAFARHNKPSIMVYGGTILPGKGSCAGVGDKLDVVSAFQSYGAYLAHDISEDQREDIIRHACPGPGSCGGMYTANTLASASEVMGMSLPTSSSSAAISDAKKAECLNVGEAIKKLIIEDIRPRDIMTRQAFKNAIAYIIAVGGSTNAVLHLIAIAHTAGIKLTIDDFQKISDNTPLLGDFKPSGTHVMAELAQLGGTPAVMKYLLKEGIITGDGMTVTGKTLKENLAQYKDLPDGQDVIRPVSNPIKKTGHLQILRGTLAPDGSVAKITGHEGTYFKGKARVFDDESGFIHALEKGEIKKGEKTVVIIRYQGPKGGPGMPEMLKPSSALMGYGLGQDCALLTDGRFSGGSHGFLIGHIVPEAYEGGPIGLAEDGDEIVIDADNNSIDLNVSQEIMSQRRKLWKKPALKYTRGFLFKYCKLVSDASKGCVLDYDGADN